MSQATLIERPYVNSNLFSSHYLDERVQERDEWDCDEEAEEAFGQLKSLYELEGGLVDGYGEDALIDNWIDEVLDILGFGTQVEVTLPGGGGFVDELLFETTTTRRDAASVYLDTKDTTDLFERGLGLLEAKQWNADFTQRFQEQCPYRNASHQIKHYLENTSENIEWGILTNGRKWRLYGTKDYETQTYFEIDLPELLDQGDLEEFKYFYVFFRPPAFRESADTTFLDEVWSESETASLELGEDLQDNVFTALRVLGRGFVETNDLGIDPEDQESLDELKDQSLILLYRLMFVLYAEARGLIHPEGEEAEAEYEENFSLDDLRLDVHEAIGEVDEGFEEEFSDHSTAYWGRLEDLFRLIDQGEDSLGIPPYNGGLFDHEANEFLTENEVSNRYLAEVIYRLSTTQNDDGRYVLADYADLDTRHLGSVYEGLLEHQFRIAPEQYAAVSENGGQVWEPASEVTVADAVETVSEGGLYVVNDQGERKATGAYYTPDYVVTYIVEETVGPLVEEIREDLVEQGFEPGTQEYLGPFLRRITDLQILDPAMGSGHFLTRATGYLSGEVMSEVRGVESETGVAFDEQHVRREIAKECIYGVDLNGMAVELAKLSMWLETLAADRPLAFLDHHLKEGNSLVGSSIESIEELESDGNGDEDQYSLAEFGATREGTIERLMDLYGEFLAIENETVEDVREMKRKYARIEQDELRRRLVEMANVHTADHFELDIPGGAYEQMAKDLEKNNWSAVKDQTWFQKAQEIAREESFFHWKLAFPEVYYNSDGTEMEVAGFDAVIGNPPWVSNWELTESNERMVSALNSLFSEVSSGHWDLFVPFCYRGLMLTRESGYHSFITPSTLAREKYGIKLREYLLTECTLRTLVNFGEHQVFDQVDRQYIIYIASPISRDTNEISIVRYTDSGFEIVTNTPQRQFLEYSNNTFRIELQEEDINIKDKIQERGIKLGHLCCVNPGVVAHSGSHSNLDFDKDDVIFDHDKGGFKKYLEGQNISRHEANWNGLYMDYTSKMEHFHRPKFPELFESPKIMFRGVSGSNNRIISCYDEDQYYTNHNVMHAVSWTHDIAEHQSSMDYEIHAQADEYDLKYVAALANSKLISYYFSKFLATGTLQGSYTGMYPEDIRKLLIPKVDFDGKSGDLQENSAKEIYSRYIGGDLSSEEFITNFEEEIRRSPSCPKEVQASLAYLTEQIIGLKEDRRSVNLNLLDYLGNYDEGPRLHELYAPTEEMSDTIVVKTAKEKESLRISQVDVEAEDEGLLLSVTARFKPENNDDFVTDRWGYTETEMIPTMRLANLSQTEANLIDVFVPVAVEKASGFANFRETATKTNSLVDRLEALTLPDPDDVAQDVERYIEAMEQVEAIDDKIEMTDQLIDEIVYQLYGLTDEEIEIVEQSVSDV